MWCAFCGRRAEDCPGGIYRGGPEGRRRHLHLLRPSDKCGKSVVGQLLREALKTRGLASRSSKPKPPGRSAQTTRSTRGSPGPGRAPMPDPARPWQLVRKGINNPPPCATFAEAALTHDIQRRNHAAATDATIFGPGEIWQCGRFPWSRWIKVERVRPQVGVDDASEPETAA